jgi:hypothetical protein
MDCITCGYYWADVNEDGEPESLEYCHFDGPDGWAPCAQDEYDEYANEARIEEEDAREEAEYEAWLEALPEEQRPTNRKEYIDMWAFFKQAQSQYEEFDYWEDSMEQAGYDEEAAYEEWIHDETQRELDEEWENNEW